MPTPDPVPQLEPIKFQFFKIIRWGALFSTLVAMLAVVLVAWGDSQIRLHMLIATALGVGLSMLLGIALMTLVFLSSRAHDAQAANHKQKDANDTRP